ncbi:MAG: nodulation protein NfeD [Candidatus Nezhaarchaeota archaeon]|nr:nodulation protein NfeD [Candidatus Nezhaarchaeota archaeon]
MNKAMCLNLITIFSILLVLSTISTPYSTTSSKHDSMVYVFRIEGTITPATAIYVEEGVKAAIEARASAIVLLLNTPGGLLDSTIKILDSIELSPIPVIAYVYPRGARAWSAGTYIVVGSHIAAMAPYTIIGSCQPVDFTGQPINDTKVINALVALMEQKAKERGRNVEVAIKFVTENLNLGADEAYKLGVINVPPVDGLKELLSMVHGMKVSTIAGQVTLETSGAEVIEYAPSLRVTLLSAISDPQIAYILMTVGILALIFGLASAIYPSAVIGAIMTILGIIGLGATPLSLGSLALIALGLILILIEALTPGFGLFGVSGIISIALGGLLMITLEPARWVVGPEWMTSFMLTITATITPVTIFAAFVAYKVIRIRRRKPSVGAIVGEIAEALDDIEEGDVGFVRFHGELWMARAMKKVSKGSMVKIVGKEGPRLVVEPQEQK